MTKTYTQADLREQLADLEHQQWAHWTAYMLDNLTEENVERWKRQVSTPYSELSEAEKDSDRQWADKVASLVQLDAAVAAFAEKAAILATRLAAHGMVCRSCGEVFDGCNHPHTDADCSQSNAQWEVVDADTLGAALYREIQALIEGEQHD